MLPLEKYNAGINAPVAPPKPMVDENRQFLRTFIQRYHNLPVLWDTSLRDYTNREKRAEAYEQLVPIYRYLKRDATVEDVKKKINTLRTNYRKQLKVVECARRAGEVHHSRCWTFHELDFLRNTEKFLAVEPSARSDSTFAFNENSQSFIDVHTPSYNCRSVLGASPAPSISEMFQKSFGHVQKFDAPTNSVLPTSASHAMPPTEYISPGAEVKRQRISSPGPSSSSQNPEELLNMACDYLSSTFPEEESIARTWAHKLKRMQRDQRLLAEKFINEILFEGESCTLHRGSVQINAFEPFVRFEQQTSEEPARSQSPSVHTSTATLAQDGETKGLSVGESGSGVATDTAAVTGGNSTSNGANTNVNTNANSTDNNGHFGNFS